MSLLRTHWWKFGEWLFSCMLLSRGRAPSLWLELNERKHLMAGISFPKCTEGLFPPSVLSLVLLLSNTGGALLQDIHAYETMVVGSGDTQRV